MKFSARTSLKVRSGCTEVIRAHHARPVGVHQVVQGFKHIGAGAWGHGVAIG